MLGLVVGSYGYAELSLFLKNTVETWGDLGKKTLPSVLGMKASTTVAAVAVLLSGVLFIIHSIQH
jgi:hypothetical protein